MTEVAEPEIRATHGIHRYVSRTRLIAEEYLASGLGPTAAMAEILAALRELDRRNEMKGQRR